MQTFDYRIVGRTPGVIESTMYAGSVSALSPKQAILAALVAEFGESDVTKPLFERLCDCGWIDQETLTDHLVNLDDDATSMCLDTGDHTFDIEVTLSIGGA